MRLQVATVLANMAARTDTRQKLLSQDLVQVLLYLLAASPETQGDLQGNQQQLPFFKYF